MEPTPLLLDWMWAASQGKETGPLQMLGVSFWLSSLEDNVAPIFSSPSWLFSWLPPARPLGPRASLGSSPLMQHWSGLPTPLRP